MRHGEDLGAKGSARQQNYAEVAEGGAFLRGDDHGGKRGEGGGDFGGILGKTVQMRGRNGTK